MQRLVPNLLPIQPQTSFVKFGHFTEESEKDTGPYLSIEVLSDRGKLTQREPVEIPAAREIPAESWRRPTEPGLVGFGAESPIPGREKQYETLMTQPDAQGARASGDIAAIRSTAPRRRPPIDEERRSKSPGIQTNFSDVSTDDFKRPHQ